MIKETQIIQAIAEHLGLSGEDLDLNTSFKDDLGLSAIELTDLLTYISTRFSVTFEQEDTEHLRKIEDLVILIEDALLE